MMWSLVWPLLGQAALGALLVLAVLRLRRTQHKLQAALASQQQALEASARIDAALVTLMGRVQRELGEAPAQPGGGFCRSCGGWSVARSPAVAVKLPGTWPT